MHRLLVMLSISLMGLSAARAEDVLYSISHPASEQVSGCEVRHELGYDPASGSMNWSVEALCPGQVTYSDSATFGATALRTWSHALRKAVQWAASNGLDDSMHLHRWQDRLTLTTVRRFDVLGEKSAHMVVSNDGFPGELNEPLLISVRDDGTGIDALELARRIEELLR